MPAVALLAWNARADRARFFCPPPDSRRTSRSSLEEPEAGTRAPRGIRIHDRHLHKHSLGTGGETPVEKTPRDSGQTSPRFQLPQDPTVGAGTGLRAAHAITRAILCHNAPGCPIRALGKGFALAGFCHRRRDALRAVDSGTVVFPASAPRVRKRQQFLFRIPGSSHPAERTRQQSCESRGAVK